MPAESSQSCFARLNKGRFGLFGGSFDPIHFAHLLLAETVRTELQLDKIVFMPCNIAPHKPERKYAPNSHRLAMIELAIQDNPAFAVSSWELEQEGVSFTVDTLEYLHGVHKFDRQQIFLIVGADNLSSFHTWKMPQRIIELAQLVCVNRPDSSLPPDEIEKNIPYTTVVIPMLSISASAIRENIRLGRSIRYWTPPEVEKYINEHNLYHEVQTACDL